MNGIEWLNDAAEFWLAFLWGHILESTWAFVMILGLWWMLHKRFSPLLGYYLFLVVLIKFILPVHITLTPFVSTLSPRQAMLYTNHVARDFQRWGNPSRPLYGQLESQGDPLRDGEESSLIASSETNALLKQASGEEESFSVSWSLILLGLWASVVFMLFLRLIASQILTRRWILLGESIDKRHLTIDLTDLKRRLNLRRDVQVIVSKGFSIPVVHGFWNPKLIIPHDLLQSFTPNQLQWVLLHELAHIKRFDTIAVLGQKIVQSLYFFNPIIWIVNRMIDQQREYICDDLALACCDSSRRDCGEGFLSLANRVKVRPILPANSIGIFNPYTMIRRRMMRIVDSDRCLTKKLSKSSMLLLLIATVMIFHSVGIAEDKSNQTQLNPLEKIEENANTQESSIEPYSYAYLPSNTSLRLISRDIRESKEDDVFIEIRTRDGKIIPFQDSTMEFRMYQNKGPNIIPLINEKDPVYGIYPKFSPDNNYLGYAFYNKGIFMVDLDTMEDKLLYKDPTHEKNISYSIYQWSLDGRYILANSTYNERRKILLISIKDNKTKIIDDIEEFGLIEQSACLSHDSCYVAYNFANDGENNSSSSFNTDIALFDLRTGEKTILLNNPREEKIIGWSPNGQWLIYLKSAKLDDNYEIWASRFEKGKIKGIPLRLFQGRGKWIMPLKLMMNGIFYFRKFTPKQNGKIYVSDFDPKGLHVETFQEYPNESNPSKPRWSADGVRVCFADYIFPFLESSLGEEVNHNQIEWDYCFANTSNTIYASRITEKNIFQLYTINTKTGDTKKFYEKPINMNENDRILGSDILISSDDQYLFYPCPVDNDYVNITQMDLSSKEETILTKAINPFRMRLSSDNKWLAYSYCCGEDDGVIQILSTQNGESRIIQTAMLKMDFNTPIYGMDFTPDSKRMLFTIINNGTTMFQYDIIHSSLKKLWEIDQYLPYFDIHPNGRQIVFSLSHPSYDEIYALDNFLPE